MGTILEARKQTDTKKFNQSNACLRKILWTYLLQPLNWVLHILVIIMLVKPKNTPEREKRVSTLQKKYSLMRTKAMALVICNNWLTARLDTSACLKFRKIYLVPSSLHLFLCENFLSLILCFFLSILTVWSSFILKLQKGKEK